MRPEAVHQDTFASGFLGVPLGIAIAITDSLGRFRACNQAYCDMLGYSQAELQGMDWLSVTHPDDHASNLDLMDRLLDRKIPYFQIEKRYKTKAGKTIWCCLHLSITGDNSDLPGYLLGVVEDITEKRAVQMELHKNQLLLKMASRTARLGGWTFDSLTQRLDWSDEVCEMHGYPPGYQPTLALGISHYPAEYRAMVQRVVGQCLFDGNPFDFEAEVTRVNGDRIWVRSIGECIRDKDDNIVGLQGAFQDITVQRQHEAERHALATKLSETLEHMSEAFFTLDRQWVITYANDEMCRTVKLARAQVVNQSFWNLFPGARNSNFHRCYQVAMDTNEMSTAVEYFAPLKKWFEVRAHPTLDGIAIYCQDITQKRNDEAQLRLLKTCMERMNDIIVITDAEVVEGVGRKVVYVNEAFERTTGYRADEIVGKTLRLLQGPRTSNEVRERIRTKLDAWQPIREEVLNYTKTGEELWLELDIVPVANGQGRFTHWIAIERNVTERKRAAEEMREKAALLDEAQDAIWVIDLDARITYWNRSAERIHGWMASEVLGTNVRDQIFTDAGAFRQCIQAVLDTGEWVGEIEHRTRDRTALQFISRLTLVRDEYEQPRSILAINTDITQQKQLEKQFLRSQRMESIGTLAGGIAHDLNNILAPILLSINMLKDAVPDPDDQSLLHTIEVSAKRGADLVRQVLSFARGVEGKRDQVNVAQVLDELQHILSKTIPRNIGIQCTLTEGIWRLQADPTQLQQVLMNLCVNARDAMPTGGRIRISAENIQLDEHYVAMNIDARVGPYVKLVVEDDGDGIDPAILDRVFDPFFTTKPLGEGTGLGLATTLAIVKSHGGFIRLNSEVGKGTRFRIYLPANTSTTWQREQNVSEELPRGSGEVILVVDDEAAILEVTRLTLEEYGYQVEVATNGAEAVAVFAQNLNRIDLVLTDMMMPVMDGPATIQAVCRLRPGVPIIAASGVSQNNQIARSVGAGVQHFLSKPYTADVLLRKLAEVLAAV